MYLLKFINNTNLRIIVLETDQKYKYFKVNA